MSLKCDTYCMCDILIDSHVSIFILYIVQPWKSLWMFTRGAFMAALSRSWVNILDYCNNRKLCVFMNLHERESKGLCVCPHTYTWYSPVWKPLVLILILSLEIPPALFGNTLAVSEDDKSKAENDSVKVKRLRISLPQNDSPIKVCLWNRRMIHHSEMLCAQHRWWLQWKSIKASATIAEI